MPRFPYYSSVNSYIEPYSSAKDGGELVTEFNQRAPINVVGWKLIDLTGSGIWFDPAKKQSSLEPGQYYSWMSGTRDEDSLKLSIVNSNMRVAPGEALVCGYYGDFLQELLIPTDEIISISEYPKSKSLKYFLILLFLTLNGNKSLLFKTKIQLFFRYFLISSISLGIFKMSMT